MEQQDIQCPPWLKQTPDNVLLIVKVVPKSSRNKINADFSPSAPHLKINLTAPPTDNAANEVLIRFLAETLDCPRGSVAIVRGATSRNKTIAIYGLSVDYIIKKLKP